MKTVMIALSLMAAALSSCNKAKQAVEAAREKIGGVKDPGAPVSPGGDVSPEFAAQVDSAAEGVRFRRDLTFPTVLKVRLIERVTFNNARVMSSSELGKEISTANGTWEEVGLLERNGGGLVLTVEKSGKVMDVEEVAKSTGQESSQTAESLQSAASIAGTRIEFRLGPNGWAAPESKGPVDFRNMMLEQALRPSLPVLLATHGLVPRTQWFSPSKRWIGGDKIVLTGDTIAMVFPGQSGAGKLTLTYEVAEALEGHPCARFSIEGDYREKEAVGIDGVKRSGEITIKSGKIWCSLIHPLVLREEYQTVMTSVEGSGSGPRLRIQGAVDLVLSRSWEPGGK